MDKKKCFSKKHEETDANYYCENCKLFMCNKCEKIHTDFFQNHISNNINKDPKEEIFSGFCKEQKHFNELKYYCKNHNKLCCAACLSKIKDDDNGQHSNCEVFKIIDIKNDKKTN